MSDSQQLIQEIHLLKTALARHGEVQRATENDSLISAPKKKASNAPLNRAAKAILDNEHHKNEWTNVNMRDDPALSFLVHDEARYVNLAAKHNAVNMIRFSSFISFEDDSHFDSESVLRGKKSSTRNNLKIWSVPSIGFLQDVPGWMLAKREYSMMSERNGCTFSMMY